MALFLALACDNPDVSPVDWAIAPADLGSPLVDGEGFDANAGDILGAAFSQVMPGWDDTQPLWDVPAAMWGVVLDDLVADEGSCPYVELDGADKTYRSDCRSKDGYEWAGTVSVQSWDEDDVSFNRLDYAITVTAGVDDPRLGSLSLEGAVQRATKGEIEHIDVNLAAELLGYFEAREAPDDPRISSWGDWTASGSVEQDGADFSLDLAADVGGSGSFALVGTGLHAASSCPVEPEGTAEMGEGAVAAFDGASACDACATITDAEGDHPACAP